MLSFRIYVISDLECVWYGMGPDFKRHKFTYAVPSKSVGPPTLAQTSQKAEGRMGREREVWVPCRPFERIINRKRRNLFPGIREIKHHVYGKRQIYLNMPFAKNGRNSFNMSSFLAY